MGADHNDSIDIASANYTVLAFKPTRRLVPDSTAAAYSSKLQSTLRGPMARTLQNCAALLERIAGYVALVCRRTSPRLIRLRKMLEVLGLLDAEERLEGHILSRV
jgi:Asp-tRNA(Asn)/Glu-tRNA(Gln) amidotransferase A subunit family amidase